jgi:hypothetical protein
MHTQNLHLCPHTTTQKHRLHVPRPPPPIAPLIPIRLLRRGCRSHRHPSPYDPTPLFRLRRRSPSRIRSPSALRVSGSTAAAFDACGFVPPRLQASLRAAVRFAIDPTNVSSHRPAPADVSFHFHRDFHIGDEGRPTDKTPTPRNTITTIFFGPLSPPTSFAIVRTNVSSHRPATADVSFHFHRDFHIGIKGVS